MKKRMYMDCAPKSSFLLSLILIIVFAFTTTHCDITKDKEECAEPLIGLATCLTYIGGTAKTPTPDCCSGLKQVLKTNKKCLCVVIKDRNDPDLGLNINSTLALALPGVCNAPANVSQCPALLNLPPNSPDAQIFYQFGQKSNDSSAATSPVPGGPIDIAGPSPTSAPLRRGGGISTGNTSSSRPSNDGGRVKGRWLRFEIMCVLILVSYWAMIM